MNDLLKIQTILGNVANINHLRASRDGKTFEGMIPAPAWTEEVVKRNGSVNDTVHEMRKIIKHFYWQAAKVAPLLKGKTLDETCHNIWDFLYTHIKYKEDDENQEQLRTFSRTFAQRLSRGVDCDDFCIAAGSILYFFKIPFYIRIARYSGKDYFQHVYPVVPLKDKEYITIDAVLDEYDAEKPPVETKDFLVMNNTTNLNGVNISVLGNLEDDELNELSGILSGEDFKDVADLEGLGQVATRDQELRAIRNHLLRTRRIIGRSPHLIREVEHPQSFLGMVDYALKYWDTDKRDEALNVLSGEEDRQNNLEGLGAYPETHEDVDLFYGLNGLGTYNVLGKAKRSRKFFTKIKEAAKKAGQGIKKIAKGLIRFNPLTVTIRAAVLLALKINLMKVASKLKWGYLTEQEAIAHGFNMDEWRKMKSQLAKAEKLFVNVLQGKAENFKKAILKGRAGKLSGTDLGLGFVVAAATTASATAAVPFITKIINLLKNINYKKLLAHVDVSKLIGGKKKAEEGGNDEETEEGGSSLPTSDGETPPDTTDTDTTDTSGSETTNGSDEEGTKREASAPADSTTEDTDVKAGEGKDVEEADTSNLPAPQTRSLVKTTEPPPEETAQVGVFTKAIDWVKANPTTSILIGAGAAFLVYLAVKPKPHHGLSGVRKGKKKKGKAKTNPPHTVSGTHHKHHKHHKPHPHPKDGAPKKFKL